jgi:hypothetical protein
VAKVSRSERPAQGPKVGRASKTGSRSHRTKLAAPNDRRVTAALANADDDRVVTALNLPGKELTPGMTGYFAKCTEKLGFIPNVLQAYAFDMGKLEAFVAMYNDLMLAPSGLSKLEREMIAVARRCGSCPAIRRLVN